MLNKLQELPFTLIANLTKWLKKRSLLIPVALLCIILLIYLFIRARTVVFWAVDAGGLEQNVMYSLLRLCNGYALYEDPHQPPFSVTQYAPFYYQVIGWIHNLIAPENASLYFYYCLNRIVSLTGNIVMVVGLYCLAANQLMLKRPYPFWIAALCFIILPPHAYCRPDSWYLVFFILSILFFVSYIRNSGLKPLLLSSFFVILALYTKQTALGILLLQFFLILLYARSIKDIIYYYLASFVFLIGLYFLFGSPDLTIYLDNVIGGVNNGISLENFKHNIIDHFHKPFLLVDIVGIVSALYLILRNEKQFAYLGYISLGMFIFATGTALKQGSALNYYIEFVLITVLCVVSFQNPNFAKDDENKLPSWLSYALLLSVSFNLLINAPNFNWIRAFNGEVSAQLYKRDQSVADFLYKDGLQKGHQIYTPEQFSFLNLILFEHALFPQHDIQIEMKGLDYDKITNFIPSKVRYILLQRDMIDIPFLGLKLTDYEEITTIEDIQIFRLLE